MINYLRGANNISIHAPRGGSDYTLSAEYVAEQENFNPRSPWGERLFRQCHCHR